MRKYRVEVWDALNRERLDVLPPAPAAPRRRAIRRAETVRIVVPGREGVEIPQGAVLRLQEEGADSFTLWRLTKEQRSFGAAGWTVTLYAHALWMDLEIGLVRQALVDGRATASVGLAARDALTWLRDYILPGCEATAVSFALGTVEPVDGFDLQMDHLTPLAGLRTLEEQTGGDAQFTLSADGRTYTVDLLSRLGRTSGGAELRYRKNLQGVDVVLDRGGIVTRLRARGGGLLTLADVTWKVQAVAGGTLTFEESPVFEDGAFTDPTGTDTYYFYVPDKGGYPVTGSVKESGAVTVDAANLPALAVGDVGRFAVDAAGTRMDFLESPSARAAHGVKTGALAALDIPDAENLIPNPDAGDWPDAQALPTGYALEGAPTVSRVAPPSVYVQQGGYAVRIQAEEGQGILLPEFTVTPSTSHPYGAIRVGGTLASGAVRAVLRHSNGKAYPVKQVLHSVSTGTYIWLEGPLDPDPLPEGTARVAVLAHGGAADFYFDAALVAMYVGGENIPNYIHGSGARLLWRRTEGELAVVSQDKREFRVQVPNLAAVDSAFAFDEIRLGDDVRVWVPDVADGTERVVEYEEDLVREEALEVVVSPGPERRPVDPNIPRHRPRRPASGGAGLLVAPVTEPAVLSASHAYADGLLHIRALGNERTATLQLYIKSRWTDPYPSTPAQTVNGRQAAFTGISVKGDQAVFWRVVALDGAAVAGGDWEDAFTPSLNAPKVRASVALDATYRDKVDVSVLLSSPVGENATVQVRDADTPDAPVWTWVDANGAIMYGTGAHGAEMLFEIEGGTTTATKFNDIPLTHQLKTYQARALGQTTGLPSDWIPIPLRVLERPVASGAAEWNETADSIQVTGTGHAYCQSATVEFSDDGFATVRTREHRALTEGQRQVVSLALADADREKMWDWRVVPYNGGLDANGVPAGLVGTPDSGQVWVPGLQAGASKPTASIERLFSGLWHVTFRLSGTLGEGGDAPLQYRWREVDDVLGPLSWESGGDGWQAATTLPRDVAIQRMRYWGKAVELEVRDAKGRTGSARQTIGSRADQATSAASSRVRTTREGDERASWGGLPGETFSGIPIRDRAGMQDMLDPETRRMKPALLGPNGTGVSDIEIGGNRGRLVADEFGIVQTPVPRDHALAEAPGLSRTTGKLDPTVPVSGSTALPVDTSDPVAALAGGADVERGAGKADAALNTNNRLATGVEGTADVAGQTASTVRSGSDAANAGLTPTGVVDLDVPVGHASSNLQGLDKTAGKLNPTVPVSGSTALPVDTSDPVAALAGGADVERGAGKGDRVVDASDRLSGARNLNASMTASPGAIQSSEQVLSATWDGFVWQVTMAAHTLKLPDKDNTLVSYNQSGYSQGANTTTYYYLNDPGLAGGSIALQGASNRQDATGDGRVYVGYLTVGDGGSTPIGGGGGGGGAL